MKRAVIYARYSCDNQTEQSIDGQLRVCEQYAKNNDILILNTYIDRAMTGTNDNRPDFQQMIKDSSKKEFNLVIVYKIDRFSRNKYETAKYKKILKDNGVKLMSATETIPDAPEGIIMESLLEGMAEYYSAELSQKVKRGMRETRLKGYFQGGSLLYGYKLDGRKIVVNEDEQKVVQHIFEQYSQGKCLREIINDLNAKGITKRGKPFLRNCLYSMLRNEKYIGEYKYGDEIVSDMYPQLIPKDLFNRVNKNLKAYKCGKSSVKTHYLLSHKLKCGYCGQNINGESGTNAKGEKWFYYKCNGRKTKMNDCKKQIIKKDTIENLVVNSIIELLSQPTEIEFMVKKLMKVQEEYESNNTTLKLLADEQRQTQNKLDNIVNAIEMGIINKTTNNRIKELETKLEELEKRIILERSSHRIKVSEEEIRKFYKYALQMQASLLITYLINEIIVYDDKIEIILNSPINKSPDDKSSGFLLCKKSIDYKISRSKTMVMALEIYIK